MKPTTLLPKRLRAAWAALALGVLAVCASITANAAGITWISADVGTPTLKGSVTDNGNGTLTIVGGGDDIWNASDNMHFYYAWASGQTWDAIVEVQSLTGPDFWSKCELMVRWSDPAYGPRGPDAFVAMMDTQTTYGPPPGTAAENAVIDQYRHIYGASADWKQAGNNPIPAYPHQWMKIHRDGSAFTIYQAQDDAGTNWQLYIVIDTALKNVIGQDNGTTFGDPFPDIVAVGVAVTAHNDADTTGAAALISHLSATFPPETAPTALGATVQVNNAKATNYLGSEVSFSFGTTNNGVPNIFNPNYQWYKNGTALTGATGKNLTFLTGPADAGAQVYCTASFPAPSAVSLNSATGAVSLLPNPLYYTNGLKEEFWANVTRPDVESGNVGLADWLAIMPNFDNPGGLGNYYVNRVSGWFIPPASDTYVFFLSADDDTDLFLSTDSNPANKRLIAQENGWSGTDAWLSVGGASDLAQKASYTWTNSAGLVPWASGFSLIGGSLYYIEAVHWQGTGGDNVGVTYSTMANVGSLVDHSPSLLQASNHNIVLVTKTATTTLTWVTQPANMTVAQGFSATIVSQAASDSEFLPLYQWYRGTPPVAIAGATSASLYLASVAAADNGAQFQVVAKTAENELSITSSVAALTVVPPVFERGFAKVDLWGNGVGDITTAVVNGTAGAPTYTITTPRFEASVNNETGDNYTRRISGFFMPVVTDSYVFFINSDDNSELFLSNTSDPAGKYMIAQEQGWSNPWQWTTANGGVASQKRTDQFVDPNNGNTYPGGIFLSAGQKYYLEAVHHEGGGGDNVEVTFIRFGGADPALGQDSALFGNLIGMNAPFCHYVAFTQEPADVTVPFGGDATLTAAGTTDSKVAIGPTGDPASYFNNYMLFQWARNGTDIAGATGSAYTFGPVSPLDNGAQFTCKMRAIGYSDTGGNPLWSNSTPATLTVSGNAVWESGFALHEFYGLNPGRAAVESLAAGAPTWMMATPAFEVDTSGAELADNFTDSLLGFFIPPATGGYVFFCNSDDDCDLFLSTDASAGNLRLIAQETAWAGALNWGATAAGVASQVRSDTFVDPATGYTPYQYGINLTKGQKYAMEAVHHQGGGGTESCINAKLITDPDPASGSLSTIRGSALGVYVPKCTYVNVTTEPQNVTVNNYANATFTAGGATDSTVPVGPEGDWRNSFNNFLFFQWYKNGSAVTGANGPKLVLPMVLPTDNGDQIFCTMRALGYGDTNGNPLWATSQVATLTVVTTAPHLLYAAVYTNYCATNLPGGNAVTYVDLAFDNPMDAAKLGLASTYTLPSGLTITGINYSTNDLRSVELAVTGTPHPPFSVSVSSGLTDIGGTAIASGSTTASAATVPLTIVDVGAGGDPSLPSIVYVDGPKDYTVVAEGSDIWNAADGFNFCYQLNTGDFDVAVRVKDVTHTSDWSKAGLMVRESLYAGARDWNVVNDPRSDDGIPAPDGSGYGANTIEPNCRYATDGASQGWQSVSNQVAPPYPNAWLRLKRTGNILTAFRGTNGFDWVQMAWADPTLVGDATPLPATVYVGICTTAHNNDGISDPPGRFYDTVHYADYANPWTPPAQHAVLTVQHSGQDFIISWTPAGGTLQSSPALGPSANWQAVPSATNPMTIPIGPANQFYRIKY